MGERLMMVALGVVALLALYALWRLWQRRRLSALQRLTAPIHLPPGVAGGKPTVLYFTTAECARCHLQQTPILAQLQTKVDVAIHKLDAIEQETLARVYGIMTVPTTVVLDPQLRPIAVNHGVAPLHKLQGQVLASRETHTQPPC